MAITSYARYLEAVSRDFLLHALLKALLYMLFSSILLTTCFFLNDYLESTPYKEWSIIAILQYTVSKSELSKDTIDILKTDSYSVLWNLCKRCNTQVKEFNIAVCQNVTSANTLQTLKEYRMARIEIEDIHNVDVNKVTVFTALMQKSHPFQFKSRNKKTTIDLNDQSESDSGLYYEDSVERVQEEVDIFSAQRIETRVMNIELIKKNSFNNNEAEEFISKKEIEECWNGCSLKKLVDNNHRIIKENGNKDTFYVDLNVLITLFMKQQFDKYEHQKTYELFWYQDFYTRIALQLLRKHSALLDSSSSEYQYQDEIVNPFLNERERLGDKHDGILYMNVCGVKVGVGFIEVVNNAFATIISDKNDDLEKLLKEHLQIAIICCVSVCMHLIGDIYIVDEYDTFVIPDSGLNLLHIGNIVKIVKKFKVQMIKYYHKLIQKPRIVTWPPMSGLPTASPSKP
ncbi:14395_t:CDS:10, partial [Funneliformis mosseae]